MQKHISIVLILWLAAAVVVVVAVAAVVSFSVLPSSVSLQYAAPQ
jgi:hypothetical protein